MVAQASEIPVPNIEELFRPTHDERARQGMVSFIRKLAIIDMRRALKEDYESRIEPRLDREGRKPADWQAIEKAMQQEHIFRFYSAVRYNAQEMCYLSVQPQSSGPCPRWWGSQRIWPFAIRPADRYVSIPISSCQSTSLRSMCT